MTEQPKPRLSYQLAVSPPDFNRIGDLAKRLRICIQHFDKLGLPFRRKSRIGQHLTLFEAIENGLQSVGGDAREHFFRALIDIADLEFITKHASQHMDPSTYLRECRLLLSRHDTPGLHAKNNTATTGRDKQFELVQIALFNRAGFKATREEPDIVVHHHLGPFSIAAKRLKSLSNLTNQIHRGSDQVLESPHPGVVATDLTATIQTRGAQLFCPTLADLPKLTRTILQVTMKDTFPHVKRLVKDKRVIGWVGYVHFSGIAEDTQDPLQWMHFEFWPCDPTSRTAAHVANVINSAAIPAIAQHQ